MQSGITFLLSVNCKNSFRSMSEYSGCKVSLDMVRASLSNLEHYAKNRVSSMAYQKQCAFARSALGNVLNSKGRDWNDSWRVVKSESGLQCLLWRQQELLFWWSFHRRPHSWHKALADGQSRLGPAGDCHLALLCPQCLKLPARGIANDTRALHTQRRLIGTCMHSDLACAWRGLQLHT